MLPLAEVFALEFTVPIWTAILAALFLHEQLPPRKLLAIALGGVGVIVIVRPGYAIVDMASLIVLASAICFAVSHVATKSLAHTEKPTAILFYMCLIQLPIGLFLSLPDWTWPAALQWFWLTIIGLTALTAHYCMAKAMRYVEVTTVVILDFLRLPSIALVGAFLYGEGFEVFLLVGGALMLLGNLLNLSGPRPAAVQRRSKQARTGKADVSA